MICIGIPAVVLKGFNPYIKEFKRLRRLLQQERHIKVELWVRLGTLRLFHVGHVSQNRPNAVSLAWHEWFSCQGREWKIYGCGFALSPELSLCRLTDYVRRMHQKACCTYSTIIFPHSTNHVIDLWRCRCRSSVDVSLTPNYVYLLVQRFPIGNIYPISRMPIMNKRTETGLVLMYRYASDDAQHLSCQ